MRFYVYRHIRLDKGTPFYVGKGTGKRAGNRAARNRYWKHITNKVPYKIEILSKFSSEEEAFEFEKKIIAVYKKFGYCEANLNGGGKGGYQASQVTRALMSEMRKGEKNSMWGKHHTEKTRALISIKNKGRKGVVSRGMLGKSQSQEQKDSVKEWHKTIGENHPQFKGYWVTPKGHFISAAKAAKVEGVSKSTIKKWCKLNKLGYSFIEKM